MKFIYDGTDMYVLRVLAVWDDENEPKITYNSYTRIKEWKYTLSERTTLIASPLSACI